MFLLVLTRSAALRWYQGRAFQALRGLVTAGRRCARACRSGKRISSLTYDGKLNPAMRGAFVYPS
jgi:hypothetical protein